MLIEYHVGSQKHKAKNYAHDYKGKETHDMRFEHDEFITHFGGRSGNVIDAIHIRTNKGRGFEAGGSGGNAFEINIPAGQTVGGIRGGKGGHIHNIGVMFATPLFAFGPPTKVPAVGGNHNDTRPFDDIGFIEANPSARIHSIKGCSGNMCLGIEVTYNVNGNLITPGPHFGSNAGSGTISILELAHDEVITSGSGGAGALVDNLVLRTSKNKEIRWGNSKGGNAFQFQFQPGKHLIAFHGGHNGDLHNIGAYYR